MSAAMAIRRALVDELPALMPREPAKVIALKIGTTPRCIHGLRQGEHVARADVLLALGKRYPAIRQKIMELMDAETGESGDDPSAVLSQIAQLAGKYAL
jgi:hypothetical protein